MVGLFRRNDPNQRQSRPCRRMTQIPANKSHPGSADVLVGHAPQGVWASPPHQVGSMRARCTILLGTAHSRLKFGPTRRSALQTFAFQVSGLPPSLPLMSPFGLPLAGYPASTRWHVFKSLRLQVSPPFRFPSASPRLRVSLISGLAPPSVLFDPLAPAQFALRANLWLVYLVPTHALDCVLGGQKSSLKKPKIFLHLKLSA